jgi:hypothetical protein
MEDNLRLDESGEGSHIYVMFCQANQRPLCRLVGPCESPRFRLQIRFEGINPEALPNTFRRDKMEMVGFNSGIGDGGASGDSGE